MPNALDHRSTRAVILWFCSFCLIAFPCYFFLNVPPIPLIAAAVITLAVTVVRSRRTSGR